MADLPLPRVVADVQAGGYLPQAYNALTDVAMNDIKSRYLPQETEAELKHKNLINQYYPQTTQAEINYKNALSSLAPEQLNELKLKNQFYPEYVRSQIANNNALAQNRNMGGGNAGVDQQQLRGLQQQILMENPTWDANKVNQAASAYIEGNDTLPNGEDLPPVSGLVRTYLNNIYKRGNSAQGINQQRYAGTLDTLFNQSTPLMSSVTKYAGLEGQSKLQADRLAASTGVKDLDYENYMYFTRQLMPQIASEMGRTLGMNSTDQQKQMMLNVADPVLWDSNPEIAMDNYKRLVKSFEAVGKTVSTPISQIGNQLRGKTKPSKENDPLGIL